MARVAADILCLTQMSTGLNDENILSLRIPMSKIISLFKKNLCLGELKMGQNRLQVKKGEHN